METAHPAPKRIHPLMATAAIAVTLVSFAGVAAMTGLLPSSHSKITTPAEQIALSPETKPVSELPAPAKKPTAATPAPTHPVPQKAAPHVAATKPVPREAPRAEPIQQAAVCHSCGRVESVSTIQAEQAQTSGIGVAAGAVLGGLLGHQVGGGNGRTLATIAGAVGGSLAGNEVERRTRAAPVSYQVRVRMEDGSVRSFPYSAAPNWNAGDRVQVVNGQLSAQG
jgi:outer membrane lipoprotein SlyB